MERKPRGSRDLTDLILACWRIQSARSAARMHSIHFRITPTPPPRCRRQSRNPEADPSGRRQEFRRVPDGSAAAREMPKASRPWDSPSTLKLQCLPHAATNPWGRIGGKGTSAPRAVAEGQRGSRALRGQPPVQGATNRVGPRTSTTQGIATSWAPGLPGPPGRRSLDIPYRALRRQEPLQLAGCYAF